jgi:ligand-binding SRPBCC domain-containing protein
LCDLPPQVRFNYTFNFPFLDLVNSQLKRYNWESKATFASVTTVQQPDDDTIIFYRRQEQLNSEIPGW